MSPARARRPAPGRGFTLLEVLVALALLSGALMAASELAGAAMRNHEYARDLNVAVPLARGLLARLEEKYEDEGFKDFDEQEEGDFAAEGRPEIRWKLQLLRPSPDLSADQLISVLAGQTGAGDGKDFIARLVGAQNGGAGPGPGGGSGPTADQGGPAAMVTAVLQAQLKQFGEQLKRSLREMRVTVTWPAGRKTTRSFSVTTHLVVLNAHAPGGARGEVADIPPTLTAQSLSSTVNSIAAPPGQQVGGARSPAGYPTTPIGTISKREGGK